MLERRIVGEVSAKPHTLFLHENKKTFEYVFTRNGFSGGFSILYSATPPTLLKSAKLLAVNFDPSKDTVDFSKICNNRRHIRTQLLQGSHDFLQARTNLFFSNNCKIAVVKGDFAKQDYTFCNSDADELYFISEGKGQLLTMFGYLSYSKNDYVLIPRQTPYIFKNEGGFEALLVEGDPYIEIPKDYLNPVGQLKLEAPYTHRDFRSPKELLVNKDTRYFQKVYNLCNRHITEHEYVNNNAQVIGWDGSVYPIAFSILDYLPKTGKIHLPPNLLMTFKAEHFVVCSFVPRKVDYLKDAIPCPYPHANVHCDEILYYVSGDFTSRKGVEYKSITHHPAGLAHGPQPGRYHESIGSEYTNEIAVMVDTWQPLQYSKKALEIEDEIYQFSWV